MPVSICETLTCTDYFSPIDLSGDRSFLTEAEKYERDAKIERHEFFSLASKSQAALRLWVSQEAVVTNPFSQILFAALSNIKNVHVRALLLPVVEGEHGRIVSGIADQAHPWLIWRLCNSLGLDQDRLVPTKAVIEFVAVLENSVANPMRALGVLGIGNELMLLSEYRSVENCFKSVYPNAEYEAFLHGNIGEDEIHTKLIENAAMALRNLGYASEDFLEGAHAGVTARVAYYDSLLKEADTTDL